MFTNVGDSLAGRYFKYRMYPFDLKELASIDADTYAKPETLDHLILTSGFPEPFCADK